MRITLSQVILLAAILLLTNCRSEFEKVRISGDPALMLEKANEYFEIEEYSRANTLYEMLIPAYRGKSEAESIAYKFAQGHYFSNSHILSAHYFKNFADTYSASPRKEEALYLSALSHYKLSPRYNLDQSDSQKAIDAFQRFINTYPESDKIEECNQYIDNLRLKMELKAFDSGKMYYNTRSYSSAIQSLENMLKDFPDTEHSEEARYIIVQASKDWADQSVFTRKEERYKKTVERCEAYLKRHSETERADQIISLKSKCEQELKSIQNG